MKFTTVAFAAVSAAIVSAQGIADIPACAQTCLLTGIQKTGCDLTDFKCTCSNNQFITESTACIQTSCPAADVAKAAQATYELCKSVGITIPTAGPASSTAAAATSSAAAPASSSEAPVSSSSEAPAPTTTAEAQTTATPSGYASAPTSSQAPAYTTQVVSTMSTVSAPSYNTTVPSTVQPSAPAYTGGANAVVGSMALAVGGAIAAFFL